MRIRQVMSNEAGGPGAAALRWVLSQTAWVYGAAVRQRNAGYDRGRRQAVRLGVPVVCVGNITAGGTGKTPMVIWICRQLEALGRKTVLLSRGYHAHDGQENDEVQLLRAALPAVPVVIDADRARGGQRAIDQYQPGALVLDDGFQHRRLARDLDIVLIDATCPFGYGHLLPRGLLREPLDGLRRASVIVITRSDLITPEECDRLQNRLAGLCRTGTPILLASHKPTTLKDPGDREWPLEKLRNAAVFAFCGLGNPQAFAATIGQLGGRVADLMELPDHAVYTPALAQTILERAGQCKADMLLTTEKDWMKLKAIPAAAQCDRLFRLLVEISIVKGEARLIERLKAL